MPTDALILVLLSCFASSGLGRVFHLQTSSQVELCQQRKALGRLGSAIFLHGELQRSGKGTVCPPHTYRDSSGFRGKGKALTAWPATPSCPSPRNSAGDKHHPVPSQKEWRQVAVLWAETLNTSCAVAKKSRKCRSVA